MDWKILFSTFGVIFLAEMGDKTQLAAMTMAADTKRPVAVFIGVVVVIGVAVLIGVVVVSVDNVVAFVSTLSMRVASPVAAALVRSVARTLS